MDTNSRLNSKRVARRGFPEKMISLLSWVFFFFFKVLFIYLREREREADFLLSGEPDVGLDPRTLGS